MAKTILLTGFEPFGGSDVNPSIQACRRLDGVKVNGCKVAVEEIPLRYKEIRGKIEGLVDEYKPSAVVSTGLGGGPHLNLERVAINVAHARIPYNCGAQPQDERLIEDAPDAYFTLLPIRRIHARLRAEKVPAEISYSAGAFGCNQIFFHLVHYVKEKKLGIPAGFIHVPPTPEMVHDKRQASMSLEYMERGLRAVVDELTKK